MSACSGARETDVGGLRPTLDTTATVRGGDVTQPPVLPTYPVDYFSGTRACGGILIEALRISIPVNGQPTGSTVPPSPSHPGDALVWPSSFFLRSSATGLEIVNSSGTTIKDGDVLKNVGVCVGDNQTLFIEQLGELPSR